MLTDEIGTLFVPHHPASYTELFGLCERGELALAWVPPIATAKLQASGAVSVLALPVRRGAVSYRAALIAHEGGPTSLGSVEGATVGWVDRESSSGYVAPRLFLAASSFDVKRLFARELFLGSHAAVVDAVLTRRVQVGATYCSVEAPSGSMPPPAMGAPRGRTPSSRGNLAVLPMGPWSGTDGKAKPPLRLLAATGPIPNDALIVSSQLRVDMRSRLLRWFLDLRDERAKRYAKDLFGASAFRIAAPEHFSALQQMLRAARANGDMQ
jgi:ABC-type phosphate/phosphonate transport system substrate-binding protein